MIATKEAALETAKTQLFSHALPVLENGVLVRGGMWPSQKLWWELPNFIRMFVGGYGSGKTIQLCKRHIGLALINSPVTTALVSPTYSMARETIVVTLEELLDGQGKLRKAMGQELTWERGRSPPYEFKLRHRFQGKHGMVTRHGRILVYSGEDPRKLKGPNLSSAGIDEPFIQDYGVFEQMVFRVRHRKAKRREVNLTGTPEQLNWGYDLAEGELRTKYDVGIVQASTLENLAVGEGYADRLLNALDPKAAQAYVHGLFVNLSKGLVYYSFDRQENVVDLSMPPGAFLGAGMDFNVNPMASAVFWVLPGKKEAHIHFFDELELPNSDTQDMCRELKHRYWERGLRDIYPDPHCGRSTSSPGGKTDYDYIEEAGFSLNKYQGTLYRRDRFNAANNMLRASNGRVRMTVSPRCKKLAQYMMAYSHELINRENQKAMSHLLDAATYPVAYLFPSDRQNLKLIPVRGL